MIKGLGIRDLCFHDLRHEATSRFFERGLNPMEVASITGHKTLHMLKRYTHLRAVDLVKNWVEQSFHMPLKIIRIFGRRGLCYRGLFRADVLGRAAHAK